MGHYSSNVSLSPHTWIILICSCIRHFRFSLKLDDLYHRQVLQLLREQGMWRQAAQLLCCNGHFSPDWVRGQILFWSGKRQTQLSVKGWFQMDVSGCHPHYYGPSFNIIAHGDWSFFKKSVLVCLFANSYQKPNSKKGTDHRISEGRPG